MFSHIRRVIAELDVHTLASSVATCSACQYDALAAGAGHLADRAGTSSAYDGTPPRTEQLHQ